MVKVIKIVTIFYLILLVGCSSRTEDEVVDSQKSFNQAVGLFNNEKYMRAKEIFKEIVYNNPLSQHSNDSQFYIAECSYFLNDFQEASEQYSKYLRITYKRSSFSKKSEIMLCRCYYKLSLDYSKDQSNTEIALEQLQYYIEKESMNEHIEEIFSIIEKTILELI